MYPDRRVAVLVLSDADRLAGLAALTADLEASSSFSVEVTSDLERLLHLGSVHALFADWRGPGLTTDQERSLVDFVRRGGAVVTAGATLSAWAANQSVIELAGWSPDGQTVSTELVVEPAPEAGGPAGPRFRVRDRVHLLPAAPPGARPLLTTHWRYTDHVVAYTRQAGAGRFSYIGLGHQPAAYAEAGFRRVVLRCLHEPTAEGAGTIGVGLLGFGALGRAHAATIRDVPGLELRCVCDRSEPRRLEAAATGVDVVNSTEALFAQAGVELVLVATPPADHAVATLRTSECDRMIAAARDSGRVLTVYQNRRWDPDFAALQRAVREGRIGDLFYMESFVGGFRHPCSLWHSHEPISGGAVYDWGSHYLDWMLQLFDGDVIAVRSISHKRVWHDVTNADQVTVEIRFASGAQASFMHSDIAAAVKPKWYLLGTGGAIVGDWRERTEWVRGPDGEIDEQAVLPTDLPARLRVLRPAGDDAVHEETLSLPRRDRAAFFRNLAGHLLRGEPLAVTPEQARRTVAVMEASTASAAGGGAVIDTHI
ncbi:MAG: hypothetical protein E6J45_10480 [Chloroflexi bacterium]|nr:MAG: hypothetical protein E6J45_10480 [Chloroflexota bacterium]